MKINKDNIQKLNYEGHVTIKVNHGDVLIKEYSDHNIGYSTLFNFLHHCLAGNFNDSLRPAKVVLYDIKQIKSETITTVSQAQLFLNNEANISSLVSSEEATSSLPIYYDKTPTIASIDGQEQTVFHFLVPQTHVEEGKNFNTIVLYSETDKPIASYLNISGDKIETIELKSSNINVVIEWSMQVGNKGE